MVSSASSQCNICMSVATTTKLGWIWNCPMNMFMHELTCDIHILKTATIMQHPFRRFTICYMFIKSRGDVGKETASQSARCMPGDLMLKSGNCQVQIIASSLIIFHPKLKPHCTDISSKRLEHFQVEMFTIQNFVPNPRLPKNKLWWYPQQQEHIQYVAVSCAQVFSISNLDRSALLCSQAILIKTLRNLPKPVLDITT